MDFDNRCYKNLDENESPATSGLDAELVAGLEATANHDARLQQYADAKRRSVAMAEYIAESVEKTEWVNKTYDALNTCGEYLLFRDYFTVGRIALAGICSCKKHLLCPLCAIRRGGKAVKAYLEKLNVILEEQPGLKPYLVTLTVRDGDDLLERFNHLTKSVKEYHRKRRDGLRGRAPVEANKAEGAVWSYEVKRGKNSGGWHPHMHAIWLCTEPPDQERLAQEWKSITGDSFIVDVREFTTEPAKGFLEVFKYAVKFSDMEPKDTWHVHELLSGSRLVASFGCFRGVVVPEEMTDDDLTDDLPYIELFYRYIRGSGIYSSVATLEAV